jgi:2-hydroxychromene-2-carboxylate isomerase
MVKITEIDFYLDFTSPYAYLASTQIEALAARQRVTVRWRPFLIGATFKVTGRKAPIEHPLVRDYMLHDVQRYARLLGQPLKFPLKFPILGVKACRLFYFLQQRDGHQQAAKPFASSVFTAYFVKQQDIMQNSVLARLTEPFGLSETRIAEIVVSSEMKSYFKSAVDEAIGRGVFGAPMFMVRDEMFWGVDRMQQLEQWLQSGGG